MHHPPLQEYERCKNELGEGSFGLGDMIFPITSIIIDNQEVLYHGHLPDAEVSILIPIFVPKSVIG